MRTQTRIGLALAGIVVLIAAAALINGLTGGDEPTPTGEPSGATGSAPATTAATGATASGGEGDAGARSAKPSAGPLIKAGSVAVIEVDKGETVRFRAVSDEGDELHVHGYDRTVELPAGKVVKVKFEADLEGVFDIEMHHSGGHVGQLRVAP